MPINRLRLFVAGSILLLSILLLPQFLVFLGYFKEYTIEAPTIFLSEINFLENIKLLRNDRSFLINWAYFLPAVLYLIYTTLFGGNRKKNKIRGDLGGPEIAGSGEFGTSRWMTEKELDQSCTPWKIRSKKGEDIEPPKTPKNPYSKDKKELKEKVPIGGVVLGMDPKRQKAWLETEDSNTLVIGTTRSGKTRTFIFPSIWLLAQAKESMVITDPKGEIHDYTRSYLEKKGYDIIVMNFRDPSRSNFWNPIETVKKAKNENDYAKASEAAWNVAHSLVYQSPDIKNDVWADGQESVIASLVLAVAMEAPDNKFIHMSSVYDNLIELGKIIKVPKDGILIDYVPLNTFFESLDHSHLARKAYGTSLLSPERMRGSFFSNTSATLRLFSDPGISHITSQQDHNLSDVGKKPTVVFLVIPDEDTTRHVLASLYIDQTYQSLVELANKNDGRLPIRVNFLLDEFGNMPSIADFDTKVTVSLGRGIRWHLIVQDLQQLKKRYRENADTITSNCHTWIYLLTTDIKTAEEISKRTGKYTIQTQNYSSTGGDRGVSKGQSVGLTSRALLTPDEVLRWQVEESLVTRARNHPARLPLPDISKWVKASEDFKKITKKEEDKAKIVAGEVFLLTDCIAPNDLEQYEQEDDDAIF